MRTKTTDAELREAVASSFSHREVLRKLGMSPGGGNHYRAFKKRVAALGLDTSHFRQSGPKKALDLEEILVRGSTYNRSRLKKRLLEEGLLQNVCSTCNNDGIWLGKPLVMHLDHKNGDAEDNRLENLRMLCPNCHTQTPTYAGRNKGK
jgi:hypothetical protein